MHGGEGGQSAAAANPCRIDDVTGADRKGNQIDTCRRTSQPPTGDAGLECPARTSVESHISACILGRTGRIVRTIENRRDVCHSLASNLRAIHLAAGAQTCRTHRAGRQPALQCRSPVDGSALPKPWLQRMAGRARAWDAPAGTADPRLAGPSNRLDPRRGRRPGRQDRPRRRPIETPPTHTESGRSQPEP